MNEAAEMLAEVLDAVEEFFQANNSEAFVAGLGGQFAPGGGRVEGAGGAAPKVSPESPFSEVFSESESRWWERPLRRSEQRFVMSGGADGLDAILKRMSREADRHWEKAIAKLQADVVGWIKSPTMGPRQILRKIARAGLDLDEMEDAFVAGALSARDFGVHQAVRELQIAGAPTVHLPPDKGTARERFDQAGKVAPGDPYQLGNYRALLEAKAFTVRSGYEAKALAAIARALQNQYEQGIPGPEAIKRLDEVFRGLAAGGLISPGRSNQTYESPAVQSTTVRTMAASAFNSARQDVMERNDDFVLGYTISEVADGLDYNADGSLRSHPLSQHLDGITIRLADPRGPMLVPPNHYNDRSVQTPETVLDEPIQWSTDAEIDAALEWRRRLSPNFV